MKRLFALAAIAAASISLHAQVVDTTVCDILKSPQSFNGKTVRVKGTAVAGFSQFVVLGKDCGQQLDAIWLAYPEGAKAKAGPSFMLQLQPAVNFDGTVKAVDRAPVTLQMDKEFKQFDSHLAAAHKGNALCLGCNRYTVTATLVGRLDGVADAVLSRNLAGKIVGITGFGNLNAYRARLVLQSVSDVSTQELDYAKGTAASKGEPQAPNAGSDPRIGLGAAIKAFGPGNPLGEQLERAINVFGNPGDSNGVDVEFGTAGEASSALEQKGTQSSPDGVLYHCIFDKDRLKDNALSIALAFAGTQVADLRSPKEVTSGKDFYTLEFHAWQVAVLGTIGLHMKTMTMPGDYVLWDGGWEQTTRDSSLQAALSSFLANQVLAKR
jgi:hypothetical protein